MTRRPILAWILLVGAAQAVGCGSGDSPATLNEVRRARSGAVEVVLLSANPAIRLGKDNYVVEFRSAAGQLVDVGQVRATASMPMPGMGPMIGSVEITATSTPGRYAVMSDLSMIGDWRVTLEWSGPAGSGSVNMSLAVQP